MNLTGKQVRAARALAGWDRPDLAERTGFSLMTIQNIELETKRPKQKTLDKIIAAFDEVGIEFIENQGVRYKPSNLEVFEGASRFDAFYDFLYEHLKRNGGDVCVCVTDERLMARYRKDPDLHRRRMKELFNKGDMRFRVLAEESNFVSDYAQYKWQPKHSVSPTSFYAFGNCLALISFAHHPSPYIVVIQSKPIAEAYRASFNIAWEQAKDPSAKQGGTL